MARPMWRQPPATRNSPCKRCWHALGMRRDEVVSLAPPYGREALISEVMRPAAATHQWRDRLKRAFLDHAATSFAGVAVVEAGSAEEEALAIAVALRETLETPNTTAALVTPDRSLARRVAAALRPLEHHRGSVERRSAERDGAGRFARLAAEAALSGLAPVTWLALLKHPLLRLGAREGAYLYAAKCWSGRCCAVRARALAGLQRLCVRCACRRTAASRRADVAAPVRSACGLELADLDAAADLVPRLGIVLAPCEHIS